MKIKKWRTALSLFVIVCTLMVLTVYGSHSPSSTPTPEAIPHFDFGQWDDDDIPHEFFPCPEGMLDVLVVGEWIYFIYPVAFDFSNHLFPFLFRMLDDGNYGPAFLISDNAVHDGFIVIDENVFFSVSTLYDRRHGWLHMITPDGTIRYISGAYDSISAFDISGNYIYYTYRSTTYGVGRYWWGLHRMNIDGTDRRFVGFLPQGVGIAGTFDWGFHVEDGWVYAGNFRMRLGHPATGLEEVQILYPLENAPEDGWIFYITDRLIKARSDGSEQIEIRTLLQEDGYVFVSAWDMWLPTDGYFWGSVSSVDSEWIYFNVNRGGPHPYRVRFDGTELSEPDENNVFIPVKFVREHSESEAAQPDITSLLEGFDGIWVDERFFYSSEIDRSVVWPLVLFIRASDAHPESPIYPHSISPHYLHSFGPIIGPYGDIVVFDVDVNILSNDRVELVMEVIGCMDELGFDKISGTLIISIDNQTNEIELIYYEDNKAHRMVRFCWERDARRHTVELVDEGIRIAYVVGMGGIPRWHNEIMIYRSTVRGERGEQILRETAWESNLYFEFIDTTAEPSQIYYYSLWTDDWTAEDSEWVLTFGDEWQLRVDVDAIFQATRPDITSLMESIKGRWVDESFYYSLVIDRSVAWPSSFTIWEASDFVCPNCLIYPIGISRAHVAIGPMAWVNPSPCMYYHIEANFLDDGRVELILWDFWMYYQNSIIIDPDNIHELTYYRADIPLRMLRFDPERDVRRYTVERVDDGIRVAYVLGQGAIPIYMLGKDGLPINYPREGYLLLIEYIMIYRSSVRGERGEQILRGSVLDIDVTLEFEFVDTTVEPGQIFYYSLWTTGRTVEDSEWVLRFGDEWQLRVEVDAVITGYLLTTEVYGRDY